MFLSFSMCSTSGDIVMQSPNLEIYFLRNVIVIVVPENPVRLQLLTRECVSDQYSARVHISKLLGDYIESCCLHLDGSSVCCGQLLLMTFWSEKILIQSTDTILNLHVCFYIIELKIYLYISVSCQFSVSSMSVMLDQYQ